MPLTLDNILDFENSYHLYFVEELFPFPPSHPTTFVTNLLQLFPLQYHTYIQRITLLAFQSETLSLGQVILRDNIMMKLPNKLHPVYIEGIHRNPQSELITLRTQTWSLSCPPTTQRKPLLSLPHSDATLISSHIIHPSIILTTRYIHSSIGYNNHQAYCKGTALQQRFLPCYLPEFHEIYAPPTINCQFHPAIIDSWNTYSNDSTMEIPVYTDGSLTPESPQLDISSPIPPKRVASAVVFFEKTHNKTKWHERNVISIQIIFPKSTHSTNYTAEVLVAAVASALPGEKQTHIYTDALGLITSLSKSNKFHDINNSITTSLLHRDYTDTGLLYKHLVQHYHHCTYSHVKAHQEGQKNTTPTEHGTGNKLADLIAQNRISEAREIAPNLQVFSYTIEDLFNATNSTSIIKVGDSPHTPTFYNHHPKITSQRFHTIALNNWLTSIRPSTSHSELQWNHLTWNLAGTLINKATNNCPHLKIFLLKFLYNALPNAYTKHKYSTLSSSLSSTESSQRDDLPMCPLCNEQPDSLSHLYCKCRNPDIVNMRNTLITNIQKITLTTNIHANDIPMTTHIINLITDNLHHTTSDHRCLLGLVPISILPPSARFTTIHKAYQLIIKQTVPYISLIWKTYCSLTHNTDDLREPSQRLTNPYSSPSHNNIRQQRHPNFTSQP